MKEITFERNALYEEVWTTPLTHLGKKYGLSDNGLRKVCKALNIPLPKVGHWAKLAAGHRVPQAPLPAAADRTTFVSRPNGEEQDSKVSEDEVWLAERLAFEAQPESLITFEEKPSRWHKVIAPLRDDLRQAAKELEASRHVAERLERNPRLLEVLNSEAVLWRRSVDCGQILNPTHKRTPTRLSPLSYERALAVLNTLCREAERRSFSVGFNEKEARIEFAGFGQKIEVRITERLEDKWRTEKNSWEKETRSVRYQVPTGNLRLYVGDYFNQAEIADDKSARLEGKLNAVFVRVYRKIVGLREREREREARERAWAAEAARREAIAARRREEEAAKERERRRRRSLIIEAKQWKVASLIREYVAHIANAGDQLRPDLEPWATWALEVAGALDPTSGRKAALGEIEGAHVLVRPRHPEEE